MLSIRGVWNRRNGRRDAIAIEGTGSQKHGDEQDNWQGSMIMEKQGTEWVISYFDVRTCEKDGNFGDHPKPDRSCTFLTTLRDSKQAKYEDVHNKR